MQLVPASSNGSIPGHSWPHSQVSGASGQACLRKEKALPYGSWGENCVKQQGEDQGAGKEIPLQLLEKTMLEHISTRQSVEDTMSEQEGQP